MFFMARTVAAMFTGFCGSKRTTEICESRESAIREREAEQPRRVVAVSTKIDEFTGGAGEHELPSTSRTPRHDFVDDDVERKLWRAAADMQRRLEPISGRGRPPARVDGKVVRPPINRTNAHRVRIGHKQQTGAARAGDRVKLHAIAIDRRGLVVELILGGQRHEDPLRCGHLDSVSYTHLRA